MIIGTPIWLWLGLTMVIPVLVHLWNKRSGRPRLLGTFRFLPEESFASAKKIELHEIPLMLVRMLIVLLLILLLAGLFFEDQVESVEHIIISETSNEDSLLGEPEDGSLWISVSTPEIEQQGWWNIFEQIEYREQPERITIRGDLSEAHFSGVRPVSKTAIDWQPLDSLYINELILTAWQFADEQYRALIQRRTELGIQTFIEEVSPAEIQNSGMEIIEEPRFILNPENEGEINLGFQYAADTWGIEVEEQPMTELAILEFGEQTIRFIQEKEERGVKDLIEANGTFGISIAVKEMRADVQPQKAMLTTRNGHNPFFYVDKNGDMVVNGSVVEELQGWAYAGIAQRSLTEAFGVSEMLTPELIEAHRDPANITSGESAPVPTEQRSAELWLMSLLAVCWLLERWLAPRRGM